MIYVFLFVAFCIAQQPGMLTEYARAFAMQNAKLEESNAILQNPHLKQFYKRYYEEESKVPIARLRAEMAEVRKNLQGSAPFGGYSSLDPSIFNRLTKEDYEGEQIRKIGSLLDELKKHTTERQFQTPPAVNPVQTAEVKNSLDTIEKAKDNAALNVTHTPAIQRPSESDSKASADLKTQIQSLQDKLNKPQAPPKPSNDEISALNRLDEKMKAISERVHQKPSGDMKQTLLLQGQMLNELVNYIKNLANAVTDERREAFLFHVNNLIYKYNLQDYPYMDALEKDMARSIVTKNKVGDKYQGIPAEVIAKLTQPVPRN